MAETKPDWQIVFEDPNPEGETARLLLRLLAAELERKGPRPSGWMGVCAEKGDGT